jgi:hypothetical protein
MHDRITRRTLLRSLAASGMLARYGMAGGLMGFMQRVLANGTDPMPAGLHKLSGTVSVNGRPAHQGETVKPGDRVTTGADGEVIYVIGQNAFLQRGGTTVDFGKTAADFMRVVTGRILSVFGKGDRQLHISTATIGIRGTACYIEEKVGADGTANERAPSYFCLCYGEALLTPTAAPAQQETIRTSYHDHPLYIHADPAMPSAMVTAPVQNHSDAELILLEGLVGRLPPFYGKEYDKYK